jgi:hypothetical protein
MSNSHHGSPELNWASSSRINYLCTAGQLDGHEDWRNNYHIAIV